MEGEFVSMQEIVVVSPAWGRFDRQVLAEDGSVDQGTVIGTVRDGGPDVLVLSPVRGSLLSWIAWAGERVSPGAPIARILPET